MLCREGPSFFPLPPLNRVTFVHAKDIVYMALKEARLHRKLTVKHLIMI